jgi:hypothetical protein
MSGADINQIEKRLSEVLQKERKEAIEYAVFIILCTPFFVAVAGFLVLLILLPILRYASYDLTLVDLFTSLNCFLALILGVTIRYANISEDSYRFDKEWIAAVLIFFCQLYITYRSGLIDSYLVGFVVIYTVFGFLVLGLSGYIIMLKKPFIEDRDNENNTPLASFVLLVAGFIATTYGEIISKSWLWSLPAQDKIKSSAWILNKLALEEEMSFNNNNVENPTLFILSRLKLIECKEDKLLLTQKGQELVS